MLKQINLKTVVSGVLLLTLVVVAQRVLAESVVTSVTVGNDSPTFTAGPAENPASDGTTPTTEGDSVTFEATATDSGSEDYYLAICQTNAITPTTGGAPTCDGGAWCISAATTSGSQATCNYTTSNPDAESNTWYAFVCDGNTSTALCSASSQGAGASGSPFEVNHPPIFTGAITDLDDYNPGDTVTWNTIASDLDTGDSIAMVICRTAGLSGTECDGGASDTWCSTALVAAHPTCNITIPAVEPHGSYDAYVYLYDEHDLLASGGAHGTNIPVVVNDIAPVVSAITLNGGSDINLTEGSTTSIPITATVSDDNSCQDIVSVETTVYRSGVTYAGCDTAGEANNNSCYAVITCSVVGGTCTSSTDGSANYTCSVDMQFHADPTDADTEYPAENWLTTVIGTDGTTSINTEIGSGVEVSSLIGFTITPTINYGTLNVGQSNDPLDRTVTMTNTGNVGLDAEYSGTNMTDGGTGTIAVGNQEYSLTAATAYGAGTDLTTTATELEKNIAKTTVTGSPAAGNTYWGLLVPGGTTAGTYTGTNTVTGVKGEVVEW